MKKTMTVNGKFDQLIFYEDNSCMLVEHEIATDGRLVVKAKEKFFFPIVDKDLKVCYNQNTLTLKKQDE